MNTYLFEGVTFDLTVPLADVIGVEWEWNGTWADGEPLMVAAGSTTSVPLPTVYRDHGPLIPIHPRPSAPQYRAAIDPDYAATLAAGYIESPAAFGARIATPPPAPVIAVTQAPGRVMAPSPLEQTGFRAFLRSLRRVS